MNRILVLTACSATLACGGPAEIVAGAVDGASAHAPFSKFDGSDEADTSCRVVLRQARASKAGSGSLWVPVSGTFDVAQGLLDQGATPHVLYRAASESRYEVEEAKPSGGAPSGFRRFSFRLSNATITPHDVIFERDSVEILPFAQLGAVRVLDHNTPAGTGAVAPPSFQYAAASSTCAAPMADTQAPTFEQPAPVAQQLDLRIKTAEPGADPCKGAKPLEGVYTVSDYQSDTSQSVHVCSTTSKAAQDQEVTLHYRFAADAKLVRHSFTFHATVSSKAVYKVDLNGLNPFPGSGACPAESVALSYEEGEFNMWAEAELYLTVGELDDEWRPTTAPRKVRYGTFPAYECLH